MSLGLRSFWMGGFESACHVNSAGRRLDLVAATQHDRLVAEDYERVRSVGIGTVREAMRWHLIDQGDSLDFGTLMPFLEAAEQQGIQIVWTLLHYGWPDGLDIHSPAFVGRFARYAGAAARLLAMRAPGPRHYSPVNEISYAAWAAGAKGLIYPFLRERGRELKEQLVRATIAATDAICAADPDARFIQCEPLIRVLSPPDQPELAAVAAAANEAQFETWDMLAGLRSPELGGAPDYLDALGVNFYHANQWVYPENRLRWEDEPRDPRWRPLHLMLADVHRRYRRPMIISETSHFGAGRGRWILEIGQEVHRARSVGVPLEGVCLYPIIDRPDWDDPCHWHNSGLWDIQVRDDGTYERVLSCEYAEAFAAVRRVNGISGPPPSSEPVGSPSGARLDPPS